MVFSIGYSQETIRKEVRVVQPYAPTLFDAFKINLLPSLKDTVEFSPDFIYEISPKPTGPADYPLVPVPLVSKTIVNQYVWVQDYSSRTVINSNGE